MEGSLKLNNGGEGKKKKTHTSKQQKPGFPTIFNIHNFFLLLFWKNHWHDDRAVMWDVWKRTPWETGPKQQKDSSGDLKFLGPMDHTAKKKGSSEVQNDHAE